MTLQLRGALWPVYGLALQLSPHQISSEVSATSLSITKGALAFLIMDHDPKMTADAVIDGPAVDVASSRHRDDTLAAKSTFLSLSVWPGPRTNKRFELGQLVTNQGHTSLSLCSMGWGELTLSL